jgi:hypothetical protein
MRNSALIGFCGTLAALLISTPAKAQESTAWQYVHPDARILLGVEWQKAKASPTGKMVSRQILNTPGAKVTSSGMEILDLVDRVLLSSPGPRPGEAADKSPLVIVIEGKIDRTKIKKMMSDGTAVERFKGVDLLVPPPSKGSEVVIALLSDSMALMGDRMSIELVLDSAKKGEVPRVNPGLFERAHALAATNEIWAVASAPEGGFATGSEAGPAKQLEDIESMEFGMNLQQGLGLKLALGMKTQESAQGMAAMIQGLSMLAASDPKRNPQMAQLVKSLQVSSDKKNVRFGMQIPLAQLERGVVEMKTTATAASKHTLEGLLGMSGGATAEGGVMLPDVRPVGTLAEPAKPAQPVQRTIKIYGAEGGPQEVTYTTNQKQR